MLIVGLSVGCAIAFVAGVGIGAVPLSPMQIVSILAERLLGLNVASSLGTSYNLTQDAVLWEIRLPRVLLGIVVGATLGVSGAALQGVFRNPLADPALIGVSSGAALGAVSSIVLGFTLFGTWSLPIAAFVGGLLAAAFAFASCGAGIGLLSSVATDAELRDLTFWSLGSLGGATWPVLATCAPFAVATVFGLRPTAMRLDLLVIGEREARHLGVRVERTRITVIALAALGVGGAVAVAGVLSFVGLVVPHLVRLVVGPAHRTLLPASALGGALVLCIADLLARTAAVPREVPLGVMTALLGAPVFFVLIRQTRRDHGGFV
jgi:iron complex transport system permease protein